MIRFAAIIISALLLMLPPGTTGAEGAMKKATFIPLWSPQAQFAGYYMAYEKGFYRKEGIDLTVLQGGPSRPPDQYLEQHKADFAALWLSAGIQRRSRGVRLVNIAQIIQQSALMLVSKKSSGIEKPQDMAGKKVSLWDGDFRIQPLAFFNKYKVPVKIVPQSFSVNLFLRGGVDVASAMWYNEYHTIINAGINPQELNSFFFNDYGLNFPEDGLYTLEETYNKDPGLACAFARASLEGWRYAFSHPEEALDVVLDYAARASIPANRVHQRWMLARMKDIILPEGAKGGLGVLRPDDYRRVSREMLTSKIINKVPPYRSFFMGCNDSAEK